MPTLLRSTLQMFAASSLTLLAFYALHTSAQSAWTPAPANAPSGNVAGPLTTGSTGQSKAGNLMLNTDGTLANGLIVANGNVGIGALNPSAKLELYSSSGQNLGMWLNRDTTMAGWDYLSFKSPIYNCNDNLNCASWEVGMYQNGPSSNQGDKFRIGRSGAGFATSEFGISLLRDGNVGIGTGNPNATKGNGGYLDTKDVYLRDAGKWASQLGGGSGQLKWCAVNDPCTGYTAVDCLTASYVGNTSQLKWDGTKWMGTAQDGTVVSWFGYACSSGVIAHN